MAAKRLKLQGKTILGKTIFKAFFNRFALNHFALMLLNLL